MQRIHFSRLFPKTLAIALSLCLLAPLGNAAERTGQRNPNAAQVTNHATPEPPQMLDEEELATLAERAEEPGPEVVGGALSNLHLTYIVIALAAAVLVLIAK